MSTAQLVLAAAAVAAAALAIRAHYLDESRRWQVFTFKPLATLLILALALAFPPVSPAYQWTIAAGLLFSTAGDVFLMLPRDRFVTGLASFLVAHLCYIGAFAIGVPFAAAPLLWLPFFAAGGVVLALIWPGLKPALRVPVAVYVVVIAAMAVRDIVFHFVNHTSYHRGFVADLFYQVPAVPPLTDLPIYLREHGEP